jgi:hypothetical protein
VHRKAEKLEQLLLRLEAGERLEELCQELELEITPERVEKLKVKYEAGGRRREALLDGRFGHSQHINSSIRAYLYERKHEDKELTAGELATEVEKKYQVRVSEGHINHILRTAVGPSTGSKPAPAPLSRDQSRPPWGNVG